MQKKDKPLEIKIFTAAEIAAFSKRNFYDEYLALHPLEKVWADRAAATTNYTERKFCWAEQEKVRLGLAPPAGAYDRGFAEFADPVGFSPAKPAPIRRRPDDFDVLSKDWEPPKT